MIYFKHFFLLRVSDHIFPCKKIIVFIWTTNLYYCFCFFINKAFWVANVYYSHVYTEFCSLLNYVQYIFKLCPLFQTSFVLLFPLIMRHFLSFACAKQYFLCYLLLLLSSTLSIWLQRFLWYSDILKRYEGVVPNKET